MRNILAVAGKELRAYFHSPIAYLVMFAYTLACGFVFYSYTAIYMNETFRMQMSGGFGAPSLSLNEYIIRPMLEGFLMVVLLFLLPLVTMRLYAEEKRSGTFELLLTSPLTDLQIILGKFLGAMALFGTLVVLTFFYVGLLFLYGNPNAKPLIANALGFILYGGALMAVGMWISTFTKNQIIAGAVTMVALLLLYVLVWVREYAMGPVGQFIANLSLSSHSDNFAKGVIDLGDVAYYLSVIAFGIFLTARSVEALKGRP
jgi:gliding motility-associated transport system permease protein